MTSILFKVLVSAYYRQNAGFFLFLFIVAFGLFTGTQHVQLGRYAVHFFPYLAMIYGTLWVLYTLKVWIFIFKSFANSKNEFLYLIRLYSIWDQVKSLALVQFSLLQPIIAYGVFLVYLGIEELAWMSVLGIFFIFAFLICAPVLLYLRLLKSPNSGQNLPGLITLLPIKLRITYPLFFSFQLLQHQKTLLFLTKILTCFLITGVCLLYKTDQYDERLISIGLLLAGISLNFMTNQYHSFEQSKLLLIRNLPFSSTKRFGLYALAYGLLLIPEYLFLVRYLPKELGYEIAFQGAIYLVSFVVLFHMYLYFNPSNPEKSGKVLFATFFFNLVLIMFKIPVWILSITMLSIAVLLFRKYYEKVEYENEFFVH
jgi:hypothetical protein